MLPACRINLLPMYRKLEAYATLKQGLALKFTPFGFAQRVEMV